MVNEWRMRVLWGAYKLARCLRITVIPFLFYFFVVGGIMVEIVIIGDSKYTSLISFELSNFTVIAWDRVFPGQVI